MHCDAPDLRVEWPVTFMSKSTTQSFTKSVFDASLPDSSSVKCPPGAPFRVVVLRNTSATAKGQSMPHWAGQMHCSDLETEMPSWSIFNSFQVTMTSLNLWSSFMAFVVVKAANSISLIMNSTQKAKSWGDSVSLRWAASSLAYLALPTIRPWPPSHVQLLSSTGMSGS